MTSDLIAKLGLPVALVIVLLAFFAKGVWPWMTRQLESSQAREAAAIQAFASLREVLAAQTEINRQIVRFLEKLNDDRRS